MCGARGSCIQVVYVLHVVRVEVYTATVLGSVRFMLYAPRSLMSLRPVMLAS